ncbi:MAG: type II toxin-antitoxin system HicB family antitoxin [Patescibacteria group bacterium]
MRRTKKLTIAEYELPVRIEEQKEGGCVAYCSVWNDCYAQGETIEEAINELSYVASSLIELYKEEGLKIPLKLKRTTRIPCASLKLKFPLIVSTH